MRSIGFPGMDRRVLLVCAALVLAAALVYSRTPFNSFVDYDDNTYVTENSMVKQGLSLETVKWALLSGYPGTFHPLALLSHLLDVTLFGLDPFWPHLENVVLHIMNSVLFFLFLRAATGALWRSAIAAAVWGLHPLNVEPVSWVASRKDLLSLSLFLVTLHGYLAYVRHGGRGRYLLALASYTLGILAKPVLVTGWVLLLFLDYWPLRQRVFEEIEKRGGVGASDWKALRGLAALKTPFVGVALFSAVSTYISQSRARPLLHEDPALPERISSGIVSYVQCLRTLFWPAKLAALYPFPRDGTPLLHAAGAFLLLLVVTVAVFRFAATRRYLVTGWLWFLCALFPMAGFVRIGSGTQAFADRFAYLSIIGPVVAVVWLAAEIAERLRLSRPLRAGAVVPLLALLGALSHLQARHWESNLTLFGHALAVTKNNYIMETNYGSELLDRGLKDEAMVHFQRALEINPEHSTAQYNLGLLLLRRGKYAQSILWLEKALEKTPFDRDTHYNLALAFKRLRIWSRARHHARQVLRIRPDDWEGRLLLNLIESAAREGRGEASSAPP